MQIAQAAAAFFDVGFQHIFRLPHAFITRPAFVQFRFDEFPLCSVRAQRFIPGAEIVEQSFVPPHRTAFQQICPDTDVAAGFRNTLRGRADGRSDFQSRVPQQGSDKGNDFQIFPIVFIKQKQHVNVRIRRQFFASVSADGRQRQTVSRAGKNGFIQKGHCFRQHVIQFVGMEKHRFQSAD